MKKFITLCFAIALLSNLAYGQLEKHYLVGGSLMLDHLKQETNGYSAKAVSFQAETALGVMVGPKVALGLSFGVAYEKDEIYNVNWLGNNDNDLTQVYLSLFLRTHHKISDKFMVYTQPYITTVFVADSEIEDKPRQNGAGVGLGLMYFINQSLSLELSIAGLHYSQIYSDEFDTTVSEIIVEYDIATPNIGIKYYF